LSPIVYQTIPGAVTSNFHGVWDIVQRDPWAGAVEINNMTDYLKLKNIAFEGPFPELECVSFVAMQMCYELKTRCKTDMNDFFKNPNVFMQKYMSVFPDEMVLWKRLVKDGILKHFVDTNMEISEVYNFITTNIVD